LADWIRGPGPQGTSSWHIHDTAKKRYENGTGDWVFQTPEWDNWVNFRERAIWLHGIPGAGKTVLASHVIEKIRSICTGKKQIYSYYYCYHGHNQDESSPFLRSIVSTLLAEQDGGEVPEATLNSFQRNIPLDQQLLLDSLEQLLLQYSDPFYVAIDALDESQDRGYLLHILEVLATAERFSKIQLFVTSRQYQDISSTMCQISQPLSMSNPFVEADIRNFVAVNVRNEPRFQSWPQSLRSEVEEALAVGAKGMFRWATCQLSILRRLHHQSKIRESLKTLPKDLDETYERIMSYITAEERDLVRYALHLVCFHDFLWQGERPLSAQLILDSYSGFRTNAGDFVCSMETLKELCGCLMTFSREDGYRGEGETVTIAHYTVREFLESSRASSWWSDWIKITYEERNRDLVNAAILFGLEAKTPAMREEDLSQDDISNSPLSIDSTSSLREYCLASSVRSLTACEELVDPSLAFRLVDPCQPHYQAMEHALVTESLYSEGSRNNFLCANFIELPFWSISWKKVSKGSPATILTNLLAMGCNILAEAFMGHLGPHANQILQDTLRGKIMFVYYWVEDCHWCLKFQGNLLQVLAQLHILTPTALTLLQGTVSNTDCYRDLIPVFITGCDYDTEINSSRDPNDAKATLTRLLQLGASPDPAGFQVTPLQISCYKRSLQCVRVLLAAGADPNNAGDPTGITWNDEPKGRLWPDCSLLRPFSELHGITPLDILDDIEPHFDYEPARDYDEMSSARGEVTDEIRRVLLSYLALTGSGHDPGHTEQP